ncbi:MAG: GNAT family N-acetyltransferase [Ilumatobacteraceae bacterium]
MPGLRRRQTRPSFRLLDDGVVRARLRPWPDRPDVAHLVLTDHTVAPRSTTLRDWMKVVADDAYTVIRTGALSLDAARTFIDHGFVEIQRLALLRRPLVASTLVAEPHHRTRPLRGTRAFETAARIDRKAFESGWDLDAAGIRDACEATPNHRIRLALTSADEPAGYMITGRNGSAGFVQRLAVDPQHEGHGVATSLILDGLAWLHRSGVEEVLINTRLDNARALDLYRRLGFDDMDENLVVLERRVDSGDFP